MNAIANTVDAAVEAVPSGSDGSVARRDGRGRLAPLLSSASPEWYTPPEIVELALRVLGGIDLDPCSNSRDHPVIPAARHFTKEDDGLAHAWHGRVYMNPPYGRGIDAWVAKLVASYARGSVTAAVALLPARTDTRWFRRLGDATICFIRGRLTFRGAANAAPFPSLLAYLGPDPDRFAAACAGLGDIWTRSAPALGSGTAAGSHAAPGSQEK